MQNSNFTNLKFSFSIPCLLTKGTKLKISFFLSRGTLYTYFLTIKTRHLFRLLPSTFHSFFSLFFFSPSPFTFLISSSNFFFPYPCVIIFLSPLGRKYPLPTSFPLQIQSVAGVYKHRRNLFPSLFTHFWTFLHISYTRERRGGEKIAGNENVRPLTLNRAVSVSAYF